MKLYLNQRIHNPYPIFFFFGAIFGVLGALVWLIYLSSSHFKYPMQSHPQLMLGGFLMMFICGFLLTAIPNFTATPSTSRIELWSVFLPILYSQFFINHELIFNCFQYLGILSLSFVVGKRYFQRKSQVPPSFVFVGFALLSLHLSLLIKIFYFFNGSFFEYLNLSKKLYAEAAILFLIFGVGCRVIPMIKGYVGNQNKYLNYYVYIVMSLVLMATYFFEFQETVLWASVLRNLLYTGISVYFFKSYKPSVRKSRLNAGLQIAELMLLAGLWLPLGFPQYFMHLRHLMYIGGFGLIALLISTRVIFAHGSAGIENEKTSIYYYPVIALTILAVLLRVFFGVQQGFYPRVLMAVTAGLWVVVCLTWIFGFYSKIKFQKTGH